MFEIHTFTQARLASITNRVEKHGDDEKPAVSLGIEIEGANTLLDAIDPQLRHALYKAVDDQEQLPGVEPATPVLRCNSFDRHTLTTAHQGWTLGVDDGIDDTKPMLFGGAKVDKFSFEAKQGGSIVLRFRVGTSDVDAEKLGMLGMHNGQDIWITLRAPEKKAEAIDGTQAAFDADHPGAGEGDATDLFSQTSSEGGAGPEDDEIDSEGGAPDADPLYDQAVALVRAQKRASISFIQRHLTIGYNRAARLLEAMETAGVVTAMASDGTRDVVPHDGEGEPVTRSTRTARGREKTKKALASGVH
jgi:hypothetical protein